MGPSSTYFIGFTSRINRREFIDVPPPPINFKDPIKKEERLKANLAKAEAAAVFCPGISVVDEIQVYNMKDKMLTCVFNANRRVNSPFTSPAWMFWEWMERTTSNHWFHVPRYVGLRIKDFLAMTAIETIQANELVDGPAAKRIYPPMRIWRQHDGVIDPYEAIFTEEQRRLVSLEAAIQIFFDKALDVDELYRNPRRQANIAHRLCVRAQIGPLYVPGAYDESADHAEEDTPAGSAREEGTASGGEPGAVPAEVQSGGVFIHTSQ